MSNFDKEWILFGPKTGFSVKEESVKGLYFIYCEEPASLKIGISAQPLSRLTNLGTGTPSQLHLVFYSKLLGKAAEDQLHKMLNNHKLKGEWFCWNEQIQGFALGVIFAVSGVIQVSWPFTSSCDKSMFIEGIDWAHNFLDPDNNWTLEPITAINGEEAFNLFQSWYEIALARYRNKNSS